MSQIQSSECDVTGVVATVAVQLEGATRSTTVEETAIVRGSGWTTIAASKCAIAKKEVTVAGIPPTESAGPIITTTTAMPTTTTTIMAAVRCTMQDGDRPKETSADVMALPVWTIVMKVMQPEVAAAAVVVSMDRSVDVEK